MLTVSNEIKTEPNTETRLRLKKIRSPRAWSKSDGPLRFWSCASSHGRWNEPSQCDSIQAPPAALFVITVSWMKAQGLTLMHGYEYLEAPGTRITLYLMLSLPALRSIELAFVSLHSQVGGWLNCVTLSCFSKRGCTLPRGVGKNRCWLWRSLMFGQPHAFVHAPSLDGPFLCHGDKCRPDSAPVAHSGGPGESWRTLLCSGLNVDFKTLKTLMAKEARHRTDQTTHEPCSFVWPPPLSVP